MSEDILKMKAAPERVVEITVPSDRDLKKIEQEGIMAAEHGMPFCLCPYRNDPARKSAWEMGHKKKTLGSTNPIMV